MYNGFDRPIHSKRSSVPPFSSLNNPDNPIFGISVPAVRRVPTSAKQ